MCLFGRPLMTPHLNVAAGEEAFISALTSILPVKTTLLQADSNKWGSK